MEEERDFGFDEWAESYDRDVKNDKTIFLKYDDVLDYVVKISKVNKDKLVLDIGTGTGNLTIRCVDLGAKVIGLDPSRKMIEKAKEKFKDRKNVEFYLIKDPFLKIPFDNNIFDIVLSTYAFHHLSHNKKEDGILEMFRVLKRGGILAIGDIMFKNEFEEKKFLNKYNFLDPDEYYERIDELKKIFNKLNVKLKTKRFTPYTWVIWVIKS